MFTNSELLRTYVNYYITLTGGFFQVIKTEITTVKTIDLEFEILVCLKKDKQLHEQFISRYQQQFL